MTAAQESVYERYGKLMVQQELLQKDINDCKIEINKLLESNKNLTTASVSKKPAGQEKPAEPTK